MLKEARFCDTPSCLHVADAACALCNGDVCWAHNSRVRIEFHVSVMGLARAEGQLGTTEQQHIFTSNTARVDPPLCPKCGNVARTALTSVAQDVADQLRDKLLEQIRAAVAAHTLAKE